MHIQTQMLFVVFSEMHFQIWIPILKSTSCFLSPMFIPEPRSPGRTQMRSFLEGTRQKKNKHRPSVLRCLCTIMECLEFRGESFFCWTYMFVKLPVCFLWNYCFSWLPFLDLFPSLLGRRLRLDGVYKPPNDRGADGVISERMRLQDGLPCAVHTL